MPDEPEKNGVDIHIGDQTLKRWSDGAVGLLLKALGPAIWLSLGGLGIHGYHMATAAQPTPTATSTIMPRLENLQPKLRQLEERVSALDGKWSDTERKVEAANSTLAEMKGEVHTILVMMRKEQQ